MYEFEVVCMNISICTTESDVCNMNAHVCITYVCLRIANSGVRTVFTIIRTAALIYARETRYLVFKSLCTYC